MVAGSMSGLEHSLAPTAATHRPIKVARIMVRSSLSEVVVVVVVVVGEVLC